MRPTFSRMNNRPEPSACKSTGRCRADAISFHVYALGSGNVFALGGASVGGIAIGVRVAGIVVGGANVWVGGTGVWVPEGGRGVLNPPQADASRVNIRMSRFITLHHHLYLSLRNLQLHHRHSPYPGCWQEPWCAPSQHPVGRVQQRGLNRSKELPHRQAHR